MALPTREEFRAASLERKKELLQAVKLRRIQHRFQGHGDDGQTTSHDCITCGVIDSRIQDFEEELYA